MAKFIICMFLASGMSSAFAQEKTTASNTLIFSPIAPLKRPVILYTFKNPEKISDAPRMQIKVIEDKKLPPIKPEIENDGPEKIRINSSSSVIDK